jgi:hypothetical protein
LLDTIRLGRLDSLSGLGDLLEDGLVREGGDDLGGLVLEGDFVALDAYKISLSAAVRGEQNRETYPRAS